MPKTGVKFEPGMVVDELDPGLLRVAPWNARKTVDPVKFEQLVESVKVHGIQVPLLVRMNAEGYEIVAGHRRFDAAVRLGLKRVPCILRSMSDEEARERGLVDNLQREDLSVLEEAQAFQDLLRIPGASVESVAAKLGKAGSYVGRRLRLLDAIPPVREALMRGVIDVGHALELARLDQAQQERLLDWLDVGWARKRGKDDDDRDFDLEMGVCRYCGCDEDNACDGGCSWVDRDETVCSNPDCVAKMKAGEQAWRPTRQTLSELKAEIRRTTMIVLSAAPFPLDAPIAPVPCVECPKRSANASLLFDDCAQDTCTDRECFGRKVVAWVRHQLEENPKLVMLRDGYDSEKQFSSAISKYDVRLIGEKIAGGKKLKACEHAERAIFVNGPRAGHQVDICRKPDCRTHKDQYVGGVATRTSSRSSEADKAARKKLLARVNAERKYRLALFAAIAQAKVVPITLDTLDALQRELIVYAIGRGPGQYEKQAAKALGWPEEIFGWSGKKKLQEKLGSLKPAEGIRAALLLAHAGELAVHEYSVGSSKADDLEKLARTLGLDPKTIRAGLAAPDRKQAASPLNAPTSGVPAKRAAKAKKKGGRK